MEQQLNLDLSKLPNVKCDKCGNDLFTQSFVIKRISGIALGTGAEDRYLDIPVYVCSKCGTILDRQRKELGMDSQTLIQA